MLASPGELYAQDHQWCRYLGPEIFVGYLNTLLSLIHLMLNAFTFLSHLVAFKRDATSSAEIQVDSTQKALLAQVTTRPALSVAATHSADAIYSLKQA